MNNTPTPYPYDAAIPMCPSFHIKAMRNTHCEKAGDYLTHPSSKDKPLMAWAADVKAHIMPP